MGRIVAQLVKNPPAMQETWVQSLGRKIPWRRERLPIPVFWPGFPMDGIVRGVAKSQIQWSDFHIYNTAQVTKPDGAGLNPSPLTTKPQVFLRH